MRLHNKPVKVPFSLVHYGKYSTRGVVSGNISRNALARYCARHPNPATRSHLALYVCMYVCICMYVRMSVTLWNAITCNCGAGQFRLLKCDHILANHPGFLGILARISLFPGYWKVPSSSRYFKSTPRPVHWWSLWIQPTPQCMDPQLPN